jgi:hypothetical protein
VSGGSVTLIPGGEVVVTVLMVDAGVQAGCETQADMETSFALRVFPPDNTLALTVPLNGGKGELVCANPSVQELKVTTIGRF